MSAFACAHPPRPGRYLARGQNGSYISKKEIWWEELNERPKCWRRSGDYSTEGCGRYFLWGRHCPADGSPGKSNHPASMAGNMIPIRILMPT